MDSKEFSILIEKYKKNGCSSREKELLENYLESFQNNSRGWIASEMGDKETVDEKIYSEIMKNINKEKNQYFTKIFFSPRLLSRAASIIFFLILASGILYISGIFGNKTSPVVWHEKVTSSGQKSFFTLSDGSKIILNADSKLRYPDQYGSTNREVYLEGEAYFEVSHSANQPFIVHSGKLSTTVLGTKFDISGYPENKTIAVSLLEGSVKVSRSEKGNDNEIVILKPKEQLQFNKEKNLSSVEQFDPIDAVGWKDNIYKFENEPLAEVLFQLERAFGVKFNLDDQSILSQKITIKFDNNSIHTIVDVIKNLTGLDYKIVKGNNDKKEEFVFNKF